MTAEPVEISITMPVQPGLTHANRVADCLQNRDELGFKAGRFYCEWLPMLKIRIALDKYLDAVIGFLSGRFRILEH